MNERKRKTAAFMTGAFSTAIPMYGMIKGVHNLIELVKNTDTYHDIENFCSSIPSDGGSTFKYVPDLVMFVGEYGTYAAGIYFLAKYFAPEVTKMSAKYLYKVDLDKPPFEKQENWESKKCKKM